jgi:phospholipase C
MRNKFAVVLNLLVVFMFLTACTGNMTPIVSSHPTAVPPQLALARTKIKHIIIIMQENRSFDHYFVTSDYRPMH